METTQSRQELHVVYGSGAVGKGVVRELLAQGKRVRMVNRSGRAGRAFPGVEAVAGDASDPASAVAFCQGASVVYHTAGAPYTEWAALLPPVQAGLIKGAAAADARLVVAENLYMYGPVSGPIHEGLPYAATTRKGRVRAALSEALLEAHRAGIVRVTMGRASNFYGPDTAQQGAFGERVFAPLLAGKRVHVAGDPDTLHSYTYIDDFARGLIILGAHEESLGQAWHIPNASAWTTRAMLARFAEEAGLPARIGTIPDAVIKVLGFFNPLVHEVEEMLYESREPFVVDSSKFVRAFGDIATPLPDGIRRTLDWFRAHLLESPAASRKQHTVSTDAGA